MASNQRVISIKVKSDKVILPKIEEIVSQ